MNTKLSKTMKKVNAFLMKKTKAIADKLFSFI